MCKSIAEGGQRCQAHTRQAVSTQMASYVAAVTTLDRGEASAALLDLEREGKDFPDPSREEVDAWLEQQITQVRYEDGLTESRRERIIRRLREAFGRVLPSGATFHAWKNIMAEAWQRSRRKAAVFFAVGVMTFSGGCGIGGANDDAGSPGGPSVVQVDDSYPEFAKDAIPDVELPSDVTRIYNEADAKAGYDMATKVFLDEQFSPSRVGVKRSNVTQDDFKSIQRHLTPAAQRDLTRAISCTDTDNQCYADASSFGYFGVTDAMETSSSNVTMRKDVSHSVVNRKISSPKVSLADDGKRLKINFDNSATLRMKVGENVLLPMNSHNTVWMKKVGNNWKIDGWQTTWQGAKTTVDKS